MNDKKGLTRRDGKAPERTNNNPEHYCLEAKPHRV
jgi:hypothetical protein